MGKENDLFKAIKDRDGNKIQRLLSTSVSKTKNESLCWQNVDSGHKIRVELTHININTQEPVTNYTPLHLAVLNGMKDTVSRLIFHCANVTAVDVKGNTALHLAAFLGQVDMTEILLFNQAPVNAQNNDGNTPLHIACEAVIDERAKVVEKLVNGGANVWIKNKYNLTPLDVSATYRRNDAIATLLDNIPSLRDNRSALIEASLRGFKDTARLLLDYGLHCNNLDENHGTSALHEAVRYGRIEVVELLLAFQADMDLMNLKKETPRYISETLPVAIAGKLTKLFEEQANIPPQYPKKLNRTVSPSTPQDSNHSENIKDYPELPNDITWTYNRPKFCSSCTEKNPNSHILDDNLKTFWVIPVVHNAWTILDLHTDHILTGITIFGWNSPQMLKTFQLQVADTLEGPWTAVLSHSCELLGSSDPKQEGFPQTCRGFTFRSRYVRLYLVDNHGGKYLCFQGIRLHGVDARVVDSLQDCGLYCIADTLIQMGLNTWKKFLDISHDQIYDLINDPEKKASLLEVVYSARRELYPMRVLSWLAPPVSSIYVGEIMPEFSVQSAPEVTEVLQLTIQGAEVSGDTCRRLTPTGPGKPSVATFSNISIKPVGMYTFRVQGINTDITLKSTNPIEVRPKIRSENDISSAFDEIQQMLSEVQASIQPRKEK